MQKYLTQVVAPKTQPSQAPAVPPAPVPMDAALLRLVSGGTTASTSTTAGPNGNW